MICNYFVQQLHSSSQIKICHEFVNKGCDFGEKNGMGDLIVKNLKLLQDSFKVM